MQVLTCKCKWKITSQVQVLNAGWPPPSGGPAQVEVELSNGGATISAVPTSGTTTRIESLAWRVRWLDRYRRLIAIAAAVMFAPIVIAKLSVALGAEWPRMHATALGAMVGVGVWCIVEIVLAWVTAVWETDLSLLLRDRGLPRAYVYVRK